MQKRRCDTDGVYQRDDSPLWWCTYTDRRGKRARRSTGETDREAAKRRRAEWLAAEQAAAAAGGARHTFDELMIAWLDAGETFKGRIKTGTSRARDERCVAALYARFSGWILPQDSTAKDSSGVASAPAERVIDGPAVYGYTVARRSQGVSEAGIRRELAVLGAAINYARARWSWPIVDPTRGRKPVAEDSRVRWITHDEATRLIEAARQEPRAPHIADWITLALHTGCRRGELLGLSWDRVDLARGVIYLEPAHNKSRKRQSVPINEAAREALIGRARFRATHCPASPWVFADKVGARVANIRKAFATACQRAGIRDFTPHDCRHTAATWLVMAGVPLHTVKAVLRHSTIAVTEIYAHHAPESARAAVDALCQARHVGVTPKHSEANG